jgi:hypothetical protein
MNDQLKDVVIWCNNNGGFVSVVIFVATLVIAWAGGLFNALCEQINERRSPA